MKVIDKVMSKLFGEPSVRKPRQYVAANRKARRTDIALRLAAESAPRRRKHEKRGAPGRASKGRKPHRASVS